MKKKIIIFSTIILGIFLSLPFLVKEKDNTSILPENNNQYYAFTLQEVFPVEMEANTIAQKINNKIDNEIEEDFLPIIKQPTNKKKFSNRFKEFSHQFISFYGPKKQDISNDVNSNDTIMLANAKNSKDDDLVSYLTEVYNAPLDMGIIPTYNKTRGDFPFVIGVAPNALKQEMYTLTPINGLYEISQEDSNEKQFYSSKIYDKVMNKVDKKLLPLVLYPERQQLAYSRKVLSNTLQETENNTIPQNSKMSFDKENVLSDSKELGQYSKFSQDEKVSNITMPQVISIEETINKNFKGLNVNIDSKLQDQLTKNIEQKISSQNAENNQQLEQNSNQLEQNRTNNYNNSRYKMGIGKNLIRNFRQILHNANPHHRNANGGNGKNNGIRHYERRGSNGHSHNRGTNGGRNFSRK